MYQRLILWTLGMALVVILGYLLLAASGTQGEELRRTRVGFHLLVMLLAPAVAYHSLRGLQLQPWIERGFAEVRLFIKAARFMLAVEVVSLGLMTGLVLVHLLGIYAMRDVDELKRTGMMILFSVALHLVIVSDMEKAP